MKSKKREDKKAQVTIFVIVGLIAVSLLLLSYYYREVIFGELSEIGLFESTALPNEVKGVSNIITSCIEEVSRAGLEIMGQQGGYIILPNDPIITPANPLSNKLEIFPGSNINVAYWFYQKANGVIDSLMPPRQRMEQELKNYIDANLENCVDFSNLNFNIISGNVESQVNILDERVRVNVEYPLEIDFEGKNFRLRDFNVNLDVPIGELYEAAMEIINKENENLFLEEKTLDFINVYDEIPYNDVDFECSPRRWSKEEVITNLKSILDVNINSFRVEGTKDSENIDNEYQVLRILDKAREININFEYSENWPLLIDITPEGEILQGESFNRGSIGRFLTPFFCLNQYNFVYDIKYPVLVTLEKDDYTFQFATQVIIDNNQPRENAVEIDQNYDTNPIICENPLTRIKVFALGINPDGNLNELNGAKVSYKCSTTLCNIGETTNIEGDIFLDDKFPQCANGQLIVEKEGYHNGETLLSTTEESIISVLMEPIYELNYEIKINENGAIRSLSKNEQVTLTFRNEQSNYITTISSTDINTIKLIDGNYNVNGFILLDSEVFIPGQEIETCLDKPRDGILGIMGLTEKKCIKTQVDGVTLPQVISGGVNFEWGVHREDLSNSKKITFFINSFGIPANVNELNNIYNKIDTNQAIQPEFSR